MVQIQLLSKMRMQM